jgi:hypothetical protein
MGNFEAAGRGLSRAWNDPMAYKNAMGGWGSTAMNAGAASAPFFYDDSASASGSGKGPRPPALPEALRMPLAADYMSRPLYSGNPNELQYRGYADGGRVIPDGMSDSIQAQLPNGQAARLSHDEFVVPADAVSGLGNGSSEAGADRLYAMLDRIRKARNGRAAPPRAVNPNAVLPA